MKKESALRTRKNYNSRTGHSSEKLKINKKMAVTIIILIILTIMKFFPANKGISTFFSFASTTTDFSAMINEIGAVVKKHTFKNINFINPCDFEITSPFGERNDPITNEITTHFGIDYAAPLFSEVKCSADGVVSRVEENEYYGKFIMVKHSENTETLYGHLKEVLISKGDKVKSGDIIGKSGDSGKSTGPHLHFEIRKSGTPVNPADYL